MVCADMFKRTKIVRNVLSLKKKKVCNKCFFLWDFASFSGNVTNCCSNAGTHVDIQITRLVYFSAKISIQVLFKSNIYVLQSKSLSLFSS